MFLTWSWPVLDVPNIFLTWTGWAPPSWSSMLLSLTPLLSSSFFSTLEEIVVNPLTPAWTYSTYMNFHLIIVEPCGNLTTLLFFTWLISNKRSMCFSFLQKKQFKIFFNVKNSTVFKVPNFNVRHTVKKTKIESIILLSDKRYQRNFHGFENSGGLSNAMWNIDKNQGWALRSFPFWAHRSFPFF